MSSFKLVELELGVQENNSLWELRCDTMAGHLPSNYIQYLTWKTIGLWAWEYNGWTLRSEYQKGCNEGWHIQQSKFLYPNDTVAAIYHDQRYMQYFGH